MHNPWSSAGLDPSTAGGGTRAQHPIPSRSGRIEPSLRPTSCHNLQPNSPELTNTTVGSGLSIQIVPPTESAAYPCKRRGSGCALSPKLANLCSSSFSTSDHEHESKVQAKSQELEAKSFLQNSFPATVSLCQPAPIRIGRRIFRRRTAPAPAVPQFHRCEWIRRL